MILNIATFNIQNKYRLNKYNGIDKYGDHTQELYNFIVNKNIDIIGVQELTKRYKDRLISILGDNYKIFGKLRFRALTNIIPIIEKYNESNSIITKHKVISHKTHQLPFFPSIPRIITEATIMIDSKRLCILNTHLEVKNKKVKIRQLNYIFKLLKKKQSKFDNIILMGDFNSTMEDYYFQEFINNLDKLGYKRVDICKPTHKCRNAPIDHIFVSNRCKISDVDVFNNDNHISDHKPIYVKLEI